MSTTKTSSVVSVGLSHHGVAASSSSKAVVLVPSTEVHECEIIYASHANLNVAKSYQVQVSQDDNAEQKEQVWSVHQTLCTDSQPSATANNTVATQTAKRVITCVSHLKRRNKESTTAPTEQLVISCGFSDGTITSWNRRGNQWVELILMDASQKDCDGRAITDLAGLVDDESEDLMLVTCTSGGAKYYVFGKDGSTKVAESLLHTASNSVRFQTLASGETLVLVGTAAPRHNKIHVFLYNDESSKEDLHYCGPLTGHEDWITCFDFFRRSTADYLASGSQDAKVRLWKFSTTSTMNTTSRSELNGDTPNLDPALEESDDDEDDDGDHIDMPEVEEGEARLEIVHEKSLTSVFLEALLIGHEEGVTSVAWHPDPEPIYGQSLILISSSMDRTILIWSEHESGVWTPISRVGSAGGILGGSVGSSLLGFLNTQIEPVRGKWLVGLGYGGALHFFSCEQVDGAEEQLADKDLTVEERATLWPWKAQPCVTGHFDGVTDLCWEAESGDYLITASNDQTCRIWASLPSHGEDKREVWVEIARPQVHGYDMSAVASLSTSDRRHLLVSGADEKEIRVFDATTAFTAFLAKISKNKRSSASIQNDKVDRVERAYIPSLGLSNKATASDGAEEDTTGLSETGTQLPLERDLGAVSLWPETLKLYGHNTELARLTSTVGARSGLNDFASTEFSKEVLLASSAKARDVDAANIRIWDVKENRCLQVLGGGHRSTVAAMSFSADGKFLASSGKDRRLCVWQRVQSQSPTDDEGRAVAFFLAGAVDSAHKRIVWSVSFCPHNPSLLASGSRDGMVKIWKLQGSSSEGDMKAVVDETFAFSPISKNKGKAESVTSISFAPTAIEGDALLALGLENGLIELWKVPQVTAPRQPELVHSFSPQICHIAAVTKLAWRPCGHQDEGSKPVLVLASCSEDHGVRIFNINFLSN